MGFEYDASGDLVEVTDVKGGTTAYTYDNHRMTSLTDANDHLQNENIYDGANRVVEQTDALSGITCVYYGSGPSYTSTNCPGVSPSPAAGETVVVDPNGNETTYGFDTSFRTTDIEDDLGNSVHFDYDSDNNVTCVTDQRGNKTAYDYDSSGNVTQIIDADNTDANCDLKQGGVDWEFTYTASNDIDLETDPLGRQTDYIYDEDGNLTRIVRKDDQSAIVNLTCFERDEDGLVTAIVESTDLTLPQDPTDPCTGHKTLFDYDTYGNQTEVVDARFSGQQDPPKTTMTYDLGGRLLTVTNALDEVTTYTYDAQNNVLSVEDNLGNTTSNTYDAKGNLKTVTDANRQPVGDPESGEDCGPAGTGDGVDDDEDDVADDGCPSAIYVYDDGDRLIEVIDALGNSTTYGYDALGNRVSVTNANRQAVDAPEAGADCGTAGTGNGEDDDSDDAIDDGCPSMLYTYNEVNRLVSETDALGRTTSYEYDEAGNLIERTDARGLVTVYEYDELNRLTLVEHWDGETLVDDVDYTYDDVGNRLTKDTDDYTYDAADQLTDLEGTSFGYDDNGNQTGRGADTFEYDHENRLTETVIDSVTSTSVYNGDGLRMSHTVDQTTTDYTWDVAAGLPVVLQDSDGNTYVYGLSLISMTDSEGSQTYFTSDVLGSTSDLTDESGDVVASYTYDVFGAIRSQTGLDTLFRFNGQQLDDGGLYYLRARYYDPDTGRFMSRDPFPGYAEKPATQHPYTYALNNPCSFVDPSGTVAKESGLYITRCHVSAKAEGIGRVRVAPTPYHALICLFDSSFCPKAYPDDVLFEFSAYATFVETASGTHLSSARGRQYGMQYGWNALGWGTATSDSAATVFGFFSGGPFDLDASVNASFSLNSEGQVQIGQPTLDYRGGGARGIIGKSLGIQLTVTSQGCSTLPSFRLDPRGVL